MAHKPTREEAWAILTDHVKSTNLISHAPEILRSHGWPEAA